MTDRIQPHLDLTRAPLLTRPDVETLCRVPELVRRGVRWGWLKPAISSLGGKELYTRQEVDRFIARLGAGDVPPVMPRKNGREDAA